jgi:hypothetical protein
VSRAGDLLREETKRRAAGPWKGKLTQIGLWFKAAEWLDKRCPDLGEAGGSISQEVLAEALRSQNMRRHPDADGWKGIAPNARAMWMDGARQLQEQIDAASERQKNENS